MTGAATCACGHDRSHHTRRPTDQARTVPGECRRCACARYRFATGSAYEARRAGRSQPHRTDTPVVVPELLLQPRDGTLTLASNPVRVPIKGKPAPVLCVVVVCAGPDRGDECGTLFAVPLHRWRDGDHRPKRCAKCTRKVKPGRMTVMRGPREIVPFFHDYRKAAR